VVYASNVERTAQFWERLGFQRHFQLPAEGAPGYIGLRSDTSAAELAVTSAQWAKDRYGLSLGDGPRFEMYVYVPDLEGMVRQLDDPDVPVLRPPGTWRGESGSRRSRIQTAIPSHSVSSRKSRPLRGRARPCA
jgi:hypothetical protein